MYHVEIEQVCPTPFALGPVCARGEREYPFWRIAMSMKQLETFMSRVQSNDSLRDEVQRCGKDNSCVVKVGAKHGHKFSPSHLSRWQKEH